MIPAVKGKKVAITTISIQLAVRKLHVVLIKSLIEYKKESSSKQVDNHEKIRVLTLKSKKFVITTLVAKPESGKLLIILTKVALGKDGQDISIRKVQIQVTSY